MLASQLLVTVATSALAILVARTLGPSEFGIFAGFLALSFAMSVLVELGIAAWLLRELASRHADGDATPRDGYHSHELIVGGLALTASLGGLVIPIGVGVAIVLGTGTDLIVVLAALLGYTVLLGASAMAEAAFRATRDLRIVASIMGLEKLTLLALVGGALWLDLGLVGVAVAYLLAGATRLVTSLSMATLRGRTTWMKPSFPVVRHVARSSLPFGLNSGLTSVIVRLDPAVVGIVSVTSAGFFTVGDRVVGALLTVPTIAASTLYPHLARSADVRTSVRGVSLLLGLIGVAGALGGIVLAPVLVPALFGNDFQEAVGVVQIMVCALPFMFASGPMLAGLYTLGLERRVLPFTALTVVAGSGLIVLGQVTVGVHGAAGAYVARQALFMVLLLALLALMPTTSAGTSASSRADGVSKDSGGSGASIRGAVRDG